MWLRHENCRNEWKISIFSYSAPSSRLFSHSSTSAEYIQVCALHKRISLFWVVLAYIYRFLFIFSMINLCEAMIWRLYSFEAYGFLQKIFEFKLTIFMRFCTNKTESFGKFNLNVQYICQFVDLPESQLEFHFPKWPNSPWIHDQMQLKST